MAEKKEQKYGDLYDYLEWRGDIGFDVLPICEVDSLIFSLLSYIDLSAIVGENMLRQDSPTLIEATRQFIRGQKGRIPSLGLIIPKEIIRLLVKTAKTRRFRDLRLFGCINRISDSEEKQFCAVAFLLSQGDVFVAFRGTDDTLVGWKEDLNMMFMSAVPAQTEAAEYLDSVAKASTGDIFVGGHSKGGNLAIYAAAEASKSTQKRIKQIYSNDGPGFRREFFESEGYSAIKDRIVRFIPESSVVGVLLEQEGEPCVVKSRGSGLYQHNGLLWAVKGGTFVRAERLDDEMRKVADSMRQWLDQMSDEEREGFASSLYDALLATGAKTLTELNTDKLKLIKAWNTLDPVARKRLLEFFELTIKLRPISKNAKKK